MAGDASFANVSLLLHMDGANNSTTFTDNSPTPKTITRSGDAKISTTQSKFGGASAYFDGTGDYLSVPGPLLPAAANFTIEGWVWLSSLGAERAILTHGSPGTTGRTFFYINSSNNLEFFIGAGSNMLLVGATALTANRWYHVAVTRSGTTVRVFLDGVLDGTGTSATPIEQAANVRVGIDAGLAIRMWLGYIDEVRVTNGIARYTANFTPPIEAFPNRLPQVSGTVTDENSDPVARTVRAYQRSTGALLGSAVSDGVTGAYAIDTPTLDEVQVVCLDDAGGTLENDLILRTYPE